MASKISIKTIQGFQILDSRNNPTVACRMLLSDGRRVEFKVPSGASTGQNEALELRDGVKARWRGKGVTIAAGNIDRKIAPMVEDILINETSQEQFDAKLKELDPTNDKSELGANAILAVSGAYARAKAASEGIELWAHFALAQDGNEAIMPVPQFNVLNAGKHADTGFEVQETMIVPAGAGSFGEALEMGTDVWYALKEILKSDGRSTGRGDEGGFVNPYPTVEQTVKRVLNAIKLAGYEPGKQIWLAFDGAFSEIHGMKLRDSKPDLADNTYHIGGKRRSSAEIVNFWTDLVRKYPIISIEDGMGERDATGWKALTKALGSRVQLVMDDNVCTNPKLIQQAIDDGIGNASLIKLNQIGTVTEAIAAMRLTRDNGMVNVVSNRSGETEDDFLGHFAMHPLADQIKSGSSGSDRNSKYNALWVIEQSIFKVTGKMPKFPGLEAFPDAIRDAMR